MNKNLRVSTIEIDCWYPAFSPSSHGSSLDPWSHGYFFFFFCHTQYCTPYATHIIGDYVIVGINEGKNKWANWIDRDYYSTLKAHTLTPTPTAIGRKFQIWIWINCGLTVFLNEFM